MMSLTFDQDDALNRKPFADRLTKAVTTFYPFADGAYVLSLNAEFGAGKTTFLEMWTNELKKDYTVISINAWETDFAQNPAIPIISAFLEQLPNKGTGIKKLKTSFRGALGATALIANDALAGITGINVKETMTAVEDDLKAGDLESIGKELYKHFQYQLDAFKTIKEQLEVYVKTLEGKPLIVMVDELDRARPDYAVEFLETIKHLFSVQGVVFVLAVNKKQLESSVKVLFGEGTNFENYYRRFITREVDLPEPEVQDWEKFIEHQYKEYFEKKMQAQLKFAIENPEALRRHFCNTAYAVNLTMREVQHLFRIVSHSLLISKEQKTLKNSWQFTTVLLAALSIKNRTSYTLLGSANLTTQDLTDIIDKLRIKAELKRSFLISLCKGVLNKNNQENAANFLIVNIEDLAGSQPVEIINSLARNDDPFPAVHDESIAQRVFLLINEWKTFFE